MFPLKSVGSVPGSEVREGFQPVRMEMLQILERRQRGDAKMERAVECLGVRVFREPGGLGRDPGSHFITAGRNWLCTRTEGRALAPSPFLGTRGGSTLPESRAGSGADRTFRETSVSRGETPMAGSHSFV